MTMTAYEELSRRYCALLGEDPDERIDNVEIWRLAMADLEAAMNALDTYGLDVRRAFHRISESEQSPSQLAEARAAQIARSRRVA